MVQRGQNLGNEIVTIPQPNEIQRKMTDFSPSSSAEPSLRRILSDPVSGQLMEDATIFPCGHSFGKLSLQQIVLTNACIRCGASAQTSSPNFALQAAVQAFKREEESLASTKSTKRRRDVDQEHGMSTQPHAAEGSRAKGVQFPFVLEDRVVIKGNKRTPECFVGREAVITQQCLNGWYLVRTVDDGQNVRLQYRSLERVGGQPSSGAPHFGTG